MNDGIWEVIPFGNLDEYNIAWRNKEGELVNHLFHAKPAEATGMDIEIALRIVSLLNGSDLIQPIKDPALEALWKVTLENFPGEEVLAELRHPPRGLRYWLSKKRRDPEPTQPPKSP